MGVMDRLVLSDVAWERMAPLIIGRPDQKGSTGRNNRMFEAMSDDPDFEYLIIDSTIVRAHQHAAGAKKGGLKIKRSVDRAAA